MYKLLPGLNAYLLFVSKRLPREAALHIVEACTLSYMVHLVLCHLHSRTLRPTESVAESMSSKENMLRGQRVGVRLAQARAAGQSCEDRCEQARICHFYHSDDEGKEANSQQIPRDKKR